MEVRMKNIREKSSCSTPTPTPTPPEKKKKKEKERKKGRGQYTKTSYIGGQEIWISYINKSPLFTYYVVKVWS